jgi:hypothetical protein
LDYALVQKSHHIIPSSIKETLLAVVEFSLNQHDVLIDCRVLGIALFHLASIESCAKIPDLQVALKNARDSIDKLERATLHHDDPKASDYQLLGQAWLLVSSLETEDDDLAIEAFDAGAEALKHALRIDPGTFI